MSYRTLSRYRAELMGVAMLWVMGFHAFDLELGISLLNRLRAAGFGGVDAFLLLSAMGLAMSQTRRETEYAAFLRRRAGRLLPAYFAVMVPYTLFLILRGSAPWIALFWNSTPLYYWVRCRGAFNWYVSGILIFYALTPLCLRRLRAARHREAFTAAAVAGGLLLCQWLMQSGYWQYMDVFYRIPIFFIGLLIGLYAAEDRPLTTGSAAFWAASLALGLAYGVMKIREIDTSPVYTPLAHVFVLTTVPACLALCLLFERLPLGGVRSALRLIGRNSLEIYLLNVSFFSQVGLIRGALPFALSNRMYYLVSFLVNIALGCLLHLAVESLRNRFSATDKG